jgi:signal transduction histidine kinase
MALRSVIESIGGEPALHPLLTRVVKSACELIGADRGTIGLVDTARNIVRTEAVFEMPPAEIGAEMGPGDGLAGAVLATRAPVLLGRYGDVSRPIYDDMAEDAVVGVPILWGDRMVGVFGIGASPPRRFTERDVDTLSLFARHAATAIENARLYDAMRRSLDETRLLYLTSQRISTAMDVEEVVSAYLDQVAARAGAPYACTICLYETDGAGERNGVRILGRWSPSAGIVLETALLPVSRDALDPVLDAGKTVTVRDVRTDPRVSPDLREIQERAGRHALAFIPLIVHGGRTGVVVLSHARPHDWPEADLHAYQATAALLAAALESRSQQSLLFERGQRIAALEERHRIARDLHDSVTQLLFGMTLMAQSLPGACRRDPEEAERRADRLLDLSRQALAEMRGLLAAWRSSDAAAPTASAASLDAVASALPVGGLVAALARHIAATGGAGAAERYICFDPRGWRPQTPEREEALYRIAQEALANALRHAPSARRIDVRLYVRRGGAEAVLRVRDDGPGFAPQRITAPPRADGGGMGLPGMRARADALGGTLAVRSSPGRGTTVEARLPLQISV